MRNDVSLGSHSHHVPHIGCPHTAPVNSAIMVKTMPTGAAALAASADTWWRRITQISEATSIISHALIAMIAAGTWIKMILTVDPCRKSSGVKKNPQTSPVTRHSAAIPVAHGSSQADVSMNFRGFAYSQSEAMGRNVSGAFQPHNGASARASS